MDEIFNIIDSALALAGYKILDGDRESVFVRDSKTDTDYEIRLIEVIP